MQPFPHLFSNNLYRRLLRLIQRSDVESQELGRLFVRFHGNLIQLLKTDSRLGILRKERECRQRCMKIKIRVLMLMILHCKNCLCNKFLFVRRIVLHFEKLGQQRREHFKKSLQKKFQRDARIALCKMANRHVAIADTNLKLARIQRHRERSSRLVNEKCDPKCRPNCNLQFCKGNIHFATTAKKASILAHDTLTLITECPIVCVPNITLTISKLSACSVIGPRRKRTSLCWLAFVSCGPWTGRNQPTLVLAATACAVLSSCTLVHNDVQSSFASKQFFFGRISSTKCASFEARECTAFEASSQARTLAETRKQRSPVLQLGFCQT